MSEDSREMLRQLAVYSHVGMSFVFSIVIGFGIGWYLDTKVFEGRTAPYLTFLFLAFGIAAGFKTLWDIIRDLSKKE